MGVRQRENGKEGDGQVAGSTDAAATFDPVVSFIMSLLAPPAVPSNRIAQALRATGRDDERSVWTKTADEILASVARFCQRISNSAH
jgi:hypothetical protein